MYVTKPKMSAQQRTRDVQWQHCMASSSTNPDLTSHIQRDEVAHNLRAAPRMYDGAMGCDKLVLANPDELRGVQYV